MTEQASDLETSRTSPPCHRAFRLLVALVRIVAIAFSIAYLAASACRPLTNIRMTDYVTQLYIPGSLVRTGQGANLYLPLSAKNMACNPVNIYTHKLFPDFHEDTLFLCQYPPVVALIVSPLTVLDFRSSLIAWQLLCLASIGLSATLFATVCGEGKRFGSIFSTAACFFVVSATIVTGQTPLILGLLPMMAAFCLNRQRRFFLSGFCLALSAAKPQLFIAPALGILGWCCTDGIIDQGRKNKAALSTGLGLAAGFTMVALACTAAAGLYWLPAWLHHLSVFSAQPNYLGYNYKQLVSVAGWLKIACQTNSLVLPALFVPTFTVASFAGQIWAVRRICQSSLQDEEKLALSIVTLFFCLPFSSPYFNLYDFDLMLIPTWIFFFGSQFQSPIWKPVRILLMWFAATTNLYFLGMPDNSAWQIISHHIMIGNLVLCAFVQLSFLIRVTAKRSASQPVGDLN